MKLQVKDYAVIISETACEFILAARVDMTSRHEDSPAGQFLKGTEVNPQAHAGTQVPLAFACPTNLI